MKTTLGTATYSPEDNKLRLSCFARLSKEDYTRARATGFIWAPKQEVFVAPMWTPEREDLLLEWCGEISDEDTSLVERAEVRADRFEDYSDKRKTDADNAHAMVESICEHIPLGQPILVGHHSEKHARKDAERIENGMRRAVKMWETSEYWKQRAAGALCHAKYKERPDVRARRIKGLEASKRKQERNKDEAVRGLKFWRDGISLRNRESGVVRKVEMIESNREEICKLIGTGFGNSDLRVAPKEGGASWEGWSAWDVLRPDGERYKACPSCTIAQCQEAAERHFPGMIAHYDRWLAHYENRLTYERAMLADGGGTATDQKGPEKGGAVKCWASVRGCWSYIQKVNKVSVTVLDNWGNGGGNFTRTIPFNKCSAIMSAAEVQSARDERRLVETSCKTGFGLCQEKSEAQEMADFNKSFESEHMAELDAASYGRKFRELGQSDRDTVRAAVRVKLGIALPEFKGTPTPQPVTIQKPFTKTPDAVKFEALRETVKAGIQVVTAPQLFPTPPDIVRQMVELARIESGQLVLEPSAGTGNIVREIINTVDTEIVGIEINRQLCSQLEKTFPSYRLNVRCLDFLSCNGELGTFDRILMNPPFANGADIKHIEHARHMLNPGGKLVAICANGPRQQETLKPLASEWIDLPAGTFKEQGTNVNTAMLVINKD